MVDIQPGFYERVDGNEQPWKTHANEYCVIRAGWGLVIKVVNGQEGKSSGFHLPALRSTNYQGETANFNKKRLLVPGLT